MRWDLVLTFVGTLLGLLLGAFAGGFVGFMLAPEEAGLEDLIYLFYGVTIGAWIGASLGTWVGLRVGGLSAVRSTPFWFVVLTGPVVGASSALALSLTDAEDNVPWIGQAGIVLAGVLLTGFLARRAARPGHE